MPSNRLAYEKSPYLLQHAHNPVDWYAWNAEAFEKAKVEDKPIFLSIGYSTCHWCHVMERESFELQEIADVLNQYFVPIKVDREERPDVDRIYMTFVQATTGSGGWPMSVWLTPDLKPFYGGTYFPPDNRYGRPGFRSVLEQLAATWRTDRERIITSGAAVVEQLKDMVDAGRHAGRIDEGLLRSAYQQFRRSYDSRLGGFGGAPKFPRASTYNFLFRYFYTEHYDEASEMVVHTLREMAKGGMHDQLGGGFHRYSVDANWFVPHFEKMLYDQAQLAVSYLEAFQITGDADLADVARGILDYVATDMTSPNGGFYSAEDADSIIDPANPAEKGEGVFYVWSFREIQELLGEPTTAWFCYRYGAEPDGNVYEDPHGEFTGKNILFERFTVAETAKKFQNDELELAATLELAERTLLEARSRRVRPHLDDKILTSWNGLMISAFAKAGSVLNDRRYVDAAEQAAKFVLQHCYLNGLLLRRFRDGEAAVPGFLDDYSYFAQGLLDLYEVTFTQEYLRTAESLLRKMCQLFEDNERGGFFDTAEGDTSLVLRLKEDYDGAEPSGNSMAILALLRLAHIRADDELRATAERALAAFAGKAAAQPTGMPQMLVAAMTSMLPPKQVVLAGAPDELNSLLDVLRSRFLPFHTVLLGGASDVNPTLAAMGPVDGKAAAYVCENYACQLPATEVADFAKLLQ